MVSKVNEKAASYASGRTTSLTTSVIQPVTTTINKNQMATASSLIVLTNSDGNIYLLARAIKIPTKIITPQKSPQAAQTKAPCPFVK